MSDHHEEHATNTSRAGQPIDDCFVEEHRESLPGFASVGPSDQQGLIKTAAASKKKKEQHFRQVDPGEGEIKAPPFRFCSNSKSPIAKGGNPPLPLELTPPSKELHMHTRDQYKAPMTSGECSSGKQKTLELAPPTLVPPRNEVDWSFPRNDDSGTECPLPPESPRKRISGCPGAFRIGGGAQDNESTVWSSDGPIFDESQTRNACPSGANMTPPDDPDSQGNDTPVASPPRDDSAVAPAMVSAELVPPERLLPMVTPTQVITERHCWGSRRHLVLAACAVVVLLAFAIGLAVGLLTTGATDPELPSTGDWQPLGQVLVGEASGDTFGRTISLSADGNLLAVGAHYNNASGVDAGKVQVFQWNSSSSTWNRSGDDLKGEEPGDRFGDSVSLSDNGNALAVGASRNDANGVSWAGQVKVFQWDGGTSAWTQLGVDIVGAAEKDRFGWSVSLSADGRVVAIGANFGHSNGVSKGIVRIHKFHTGSWHQHGQVLVGEALGDKFGYSVSLSADGKIVAVGARLNNPDGKLDAGKVQIFQWNNTASRWTHLGDDLVGEASNDSFGHSVSLSANGHVVAVGAAASNDGAGGFEEGRARVYRWDGGSWEPLGQDLVGKASGDRFGVYVSLSWDGHMVAVGANQLRSSGNATGYVQVFQLTGNEWQQVGSDLYGSRNHDQFGTCVSLSNDGTILGVGATQWAHPNPDPPGYVQVFRLQQEI